MSSPFVKLLQREQERSQLSSARFARDVLGISPSAWSLVKDGQRGPGSRVIGGALRAFPKLRSEIAAALAAGHHHDRSVQELKKL